MGDLNQVTYLKKFLPRIAGPILEIGSKDYGSTASFRDFYTDNEYIGTDLAEGKNVDLVLDLTQDTGPLRPNHFALGICCSVLEHVRKPWLMAENISSLIKPGGKVYISVPWVWRFHAYPDDFYRFSHRGVPNCFQNSSGRRCITRPTSKANSWKSTKPTPTSTTRWPS